MEFEKGWEELKDKYNLDKKHRLSKMYKQRHHWIHLDLKDVFFVGMTSSQRSESMNFHFDGYFNSHTTLKEFVKQLTMQWLIDMQQNWMKTLGQWIQYDYQFLC